MPHQPFLDRRLAAIEERLKRIEERLNQHQREMVQFRRFAHLRAEPTESVFFKNHPDADEEEE